MTSCDVDQFIKWAAGEPCGRRRAWPRNWNSIIGYILELIGENTENELEVKDWHHGKLSVDILSQKKGVFRSVLSPLLRTGLVSRDITNEFGQIGTDYRLWRYM